MGKFSFALIGCGRNSKNHITAIATNAEVMELVASVQDPIEAFAEKNKQTAYFGAIGKNGCDLYRL